MLEVKLSQLIMSASGTTVVVRFYWRVPGSEQDTFRRALICERQLAFGRLLTRLALIREINRLLLRVAAERRISAALAEYVRAE